MKTLVVVQARTGSSRLPGKVLLPLAGAPLLARMIERLRPAHTVFDLVVATTTASADDPVRALAVEHGWDVYSGHPTDLLDRHYQAALARHADVVVKIPSDCPLIDASIVDRVIGAYLDADGRWDFVSNLHPPSWPDGNDVEVMSFAALEIAWREAKQPHEREHTTPFLWDQPARFRIGNVCWERGLDLSMSHRLTIDYADDYRLIAAVYAHLWRPERPVFGLDEILALLESNPAIYALNARYAGVNWYRRHLAELRTVGAESTRPMEKTHDA